MPHTVQEKLKGLLARAGTFQKGKPGAGTELPAEGPAPARKGAVSGEGAADVSAAQVLDGIIEEAVKRGASDIHLEPFEKGLRVRLRTDGSLQDHSFHAPAASSLIISRAKILAGMDIAEKRLPQDGNLQLMRHGQAINIRASTMPTIYGEKVALRLLDPSRIIIPVEKLGFNAQNRKRYLGFLENAHGMVLVTGPTGCGKTTTLYSTLHYINDSTESIITVEDPVEYRLEGVNQVQVNSKIKLTFASALRSILRQDPNVVMVGEIRDRDTAEIATRAALTGHLVFSTLHTNDASRAVTRLMDMGVEPYLLNASLVGVVAQRLVRLVCTHCREEYVPGEERLLYLEITGDEEPVPFVRGRGCQLCNMTGFKGRTAIHEVMPVDAGMRRLILETTDTDAIRRHALAGGMKTLLQDGMQRVKEGRTTFQEVIKEAYTTL